jgi:hypothetical protein
VKENSGQSRRSTAAGFSLSFAGMFFRKKQNRQRKLSVHQKQMRRWRNGLVLFFTVMFAVGFYFMAKRMNHMGH